MTDPTEAAPASAPVVQLTNAEKLKIWFSQPTTLQAAAYAVTIVSAWVSHTLPAGLAEGGLLGCALLALVNDNTYAITVARALLAKAGVNG